MTKRDTKYYQEGENFYLVGTLFRYNQPNINGNMIPKELAEKFVTEYNSKEPNKKNFVVCMDHEAFMKTTATVLSEVVGQCEEVYIDKEKNKVEAKIKLIETENGNLLKKYITELNYYPALNPMYMVDSVTPSQDGSHNVLGGNILLVSINCVAPFSDE